VRILEQDNCTECRMIESVQSLDVVLDRGYAFSQRSNPKRDWSMKSLFGKPLKKLCPLAKSTVIYVDTSLARKYGEWSVTPSSTCVIRSSDDKNDFVLDTFDLHLQNFTDPTHEFDLAFKWTVPEQRASAEHYKSNTNNKDGVSLARHMTRDDKLEVVFYNTLSDSVPVHFFDVIPWYIKLYFHTLTLRVNDSLRVPPSSAWLHHKFVPSEDRGAPSMIEIRMDLPPHSLTTIAVDFERAFLHYTEYPPDPHRGFDIGSAVITHIRSDPATAYTIVAASNTTRSSRMSAMPLFNTIIRYKSSPTRFYSGGALVSLPTPDFSMPYNVLTFSGAVVGIFFASMFKLLTSSPERIGLAKEEGVSWSGRMREWLRRLLGFLIFWKRKKQ